MSNVYATYDSDGTTITGLFANPQSFTTAPIDSEDPKVLAFLTPNPVPQSVSACQARLALNAAGLLNEVNTAVNAAGGATLITWEYATTINRTDPLIASVGTSMGLTSAAIDALFVEAAALTP